MQQADERALADLKNAYGGNLVGKVPSLGWPYAEAARIRLDCFDDQWWCVFEPSTYVDRPRIEPRQASAPKHSDRGTESGWRKERWARRYNPTWAAIIDAWASLLVEGKTQNRSAYPQAAGVGSPATFLISRSTGWSRPAGQGVSA